MAKNPAKVIEEIDVTPPSEEKLDFDDDNLIAIAQVYNNEGNDEYRKKEFTNAIYFYTEGIKVNCKDNELNSKLYSNRATAHFKMGNYRETLDDAKAAIRLEPAFIKAIERGASACVELHRFEEAITWCDKGLTIDNNSRTLLNLRKRSVDTLTELQKTGNPYVYDLPGNGHPVDTKTVVDYHEQHLKMAKELGDIAGEGRANSNLGNAYVDLGDYSAAIRYHERRLEIARESKHRAGEGLAFCDLGSAYRRLGDLKRAIDYYERSLQVAIEVGNRNGEGVTYGNLGNVYRQLGELVKAKDYHERCLKIAKELGNVVLEVSANGNLGSVYISLGDFKNACNCFERSLQIAKEIGNRAGEGMAYGNLGVAYQELGDFEKAIDYLQRSLEINSELGNRSAEASLYGNLGNAHKHLGDLKKAMNYHELRLKIAKEVGDRVLEMSSYGDLGNGYVSLGDFKTAIGYFERSLQIAKEVSNRTSEGKVYGSLGVTYLKCGDFEKAIECFKRSLEVHKELGDRSGETTLYGNLGVSYKDIGDFKNAIVHHELQLKFAQELEKKVEEGRAHANLANSYAGLGDLKNAREHYKLSLGIAKEVGDKEGEAMRNYNLGYLFEAGLGYLPEALNCYQSSVEILNDVRDRLEDKDEWKISLRHMFQTVYSSLWSLLLKQGKIVEALSAADQGRAQALKDLLELNYGFARPCVRSDSVVEGAYGTLSCGLPTNTVFIAVHKQEIIYWVVQKAKDVTLRRQEIGDDPAGDATSFLQSLLENARTKIGVRACVRCEDRSLDTLRDDMEPPHERSDETGSDTSEVQTNALRKLYDVVFGPIADLVRGDEFTIVPDGPLWLAPTTAFMDSNSKYLGESFRIRVLPSLYTLKLIADCPANFHCKSGVLLVGDPCVEQITNRKGKKLLGQLPCAREEVQIIGRILKTSPLVGTEASKEEVLQRLSTVALIHIAAHGRMETGEIALAPNPTRASRRPKEEDYLLTMKDALNAKLQARLVVLSCCHSGRGDIKAEGVVGIARAFLGAGARSVLVSLWAIDDAATLEFMKNFYQHLVEGRSASEALNRAMNSMRESEEFSKVKYWAPFVLIGDDVTLEFGGSD